MRDALRAGLLSGVRKGWQGFVWMIEIILPVSLVTMLLSWSGWLYRLDAVFAPAMDLFSLPPHAALPLLMGVLSSVYGGIAAMSVLPFSTGQLTVMAVFILMAHSLIQETIIQARSGIHPAKTAAFRLVTASLTAMIVSQWIEMGSSTRIAAPVLEARLPLADALTEWFVATAWLTGKILVIIMALITFLEVLKSLGWMHTLVRFSSPLLRLMGLSPPVGMLWMTAAVFGLGYSGAVIVDEVRRGRLDAQDLELLHLSIGVNHSLVEDPPLFASMGLPVLWLYVPRFIVAVLAVHAIRGWRRIRRGTAPGNGPSRFLRRPGSSAIPESKSAGRRKR